MSFPVQVKTSKVSDDSIVKIYYPQIIKMENKQLEHKMNQMIVKEVEQLSAEQVDDLPSSVVEMIGSYELKNNQRDVLSLALSNYVYYYHAAHGMTRLKSLTFDIKTGKKYELKDLFKSDSNYIEVLSEQIKEQIKQREIPLLSDFSTIQPNQDFYIADKTIVIYFQLYELTAYAYGMPMFPISVFTLQDIIAENSPLERMLASV